MRHKTIAVIVLLTSLFGTATLQAQTEQFGNISGQLFDKETLKPVVGATVYIVGTKLGAISDFDGNFLIVAQLRAGEYSLRISRLGYMMVTIDHVIVVADSATEITQYLLKDTTRLENIITIEQERAYRHDMTISQVTISEKYIKAHPVSTIDELLELVSGYELDSAGTISISEQDIDSLSVSTVDSIPWYAGLTDTDYFSIVVPEAELSRLVDSLGHNEFMPAITDFLRVIDSIRPWLPEAAKYTRWQDRELDFILFRLMQEDFFAEAFGPHGLDITASDLELYDEHHYISRDSETVFSSEQFKESYEVLAKAWRNIAERFRPIVDSRDEIFSMSVVVGGYGRIDVEKNEDSNSDRIGESFIIGMGVNLWNSSYTDSLQVEQYVQIRNFSTHFHVLYPFLSQDTVRYYVVMVLKKE